MACVKTLALMSLLVKMLTAGDSGFFFGTLNDNYTGSVQNGMDGTYIGPDDFLTFSFLAGLRLNSYRTFISYNIITSRVFGFRYDLLNAGASKDFRFKSIGYRTGLELTYKGTLGGEQIQNGFHDLKSLPEVNLPYDGGAMGLGITLDADYTRPSLLLNPDLLQLGMESRLSTLLPFKTGVNGSYAIGWQRVGTEVLLGYRFYANNINHYSELIRSGFIYGANLKLKLYRDSGVNLGMVFFTAENLDNDPLYREKDFSTSPQLWVMFSIRGEKLGLREFIRMF